MMYIITDNAIEISKELYRLSRPIDFESDSMMFGVITHSDKRTALEVDLDAEILIHPLKDTTTLKNLVNYTPEQVQQLEDYFDSVQLDQDGEEPESGWVLGRFPFGNIVTGFTEIYDEQYMINNGWIENTEL